MKKSILLVVATLVGVTVAPALTTNSQNVQASETTVREAKSVKVYGPMPTVAICIETVPGWITILKQIETDGLACIQEM